MTTQPHPEQPVAPAPPPSCSSCAYYVTGECHRHAPGAVTYATGGDKRVVDIAWPKVEPGDWCGDYAARA